MNLTELTWSDQDLETLLHFIRQRKLSYQPFRFCDDHEVGEGMAFLAGTSTQGVKGVVNWPQPPSDISDLTVAPDGVNLFKEANDELRRIYECFIAHVCCGLKSVAGLDFAEFGCNTGYFLYRFCQEGAHKAIGLDFTYNKEVFDFFNNKLGTTAEFRFAEWDSLLHCSHYSDLPEVDCCISVAVLCHLADPLHHLTYLCSKARQAIFVWTPTHDSDDLFLSFGKPALFPNSLAWPVGFDNLVKPSRGLLELCLRECGFDDLRYLKPIPGKFDEINFWAHHTGVLALRTREVKTIFTGGLKRRPKPADVTLEEPAPSSSWKRWFKKATNPG